MSHNLFSFLSPICCQLKPLILLSAFSVLFHQQFISFLFSYFFQCTLSFCLILRFHMKSGQRNITGGRNEKPIRAEMTQRHLPRQIIVEQESVYMHDLRGSRKMITRLITKTWGQTVWTKMGWLRIRRRISRLNVRLVAF